MLQTMLQEVPAVVTVSSDEGVAVPMAPAREKPVGGQALPTGSNQSLRVNVSRAAGSIWAVTSRVVAVEHAAITAVAMARAKTRATREPRWETRARAARPRVTRTLTPPSRPAASTGGGVRLTVTVPVDFVVAKPCPFW